MKRKEAILSQKAIDAPGSWANGVIAGADQPSVAERFGALETNWPTLGHVGVLIGGSSTSIRARSAGPVRLGIERPLRIHPPVLAVTLLRHRRGKDEVLVGVRTKHNGTHQNVMSVPTIRVLPEVAAGWVKPLADGALSTDGLRRRRSVHRGVRHVVREVLALKLGMSDALERHEIDFQVEAMMAIQGTSLLGSHAGQDVTEDLTMFNAQVRWTLGQDLSQDRTVSYDPLLWITEDQFAQMVRTRDVGVLDAGLNEIEVCVRGLCVDSTALMLAR